MSRMVPGQVVEFVVCGHAFHGGKGWKLLHVLVDLFHVSYCRAL